MASPTMEEHQRAGVLRCAGCRRSETGYLSAKPMSLMRAEQITSRTLVAWDIKHEFIEPVQTAMRRLLTWAIEEAAAATITSAAPGGQDVGPCPPSMVGWGLVRHVDGIIVEVCDAGTHSPPTHLYFDLPRPFGLYWWHDDDGRLIGRLLWCGVRIGAAARQRSDDRATQAVRWLPSGDPPLNHHALDGPKLLDRELYSEVFGLWAGLCPPVMRRNA
ncbi:MAG: hypothetical protein JO115_02215 [Pseudonocardiales bacterium]|nr:hypothetical protein [Pseudonocardiales bacterium]